MKISICMLFLELMGDYGREKHLLEPYWEKHNSMLHRVFGTCEDIFVVYSARRIETEKKILENIFFFKKYDIVKIVSCDYRETPPTA